MKTSVRNLLVQGHYTITLPIIMIYAASYLLFDVSIIILVFTTVIAWRFWSYAVPKWKLSSIKNLDTISEYLEWNSKAISTGLIWPDDSFLSSTEIWDQEEQSEYSRLRGDLMNMNSNTSE